MKIFISAKGLLGLLMIMSLASCEDFLQIETPNHKMVGEVIFNSDDTALSAMQGIYNQLFLSSFSNGGFDSVTVLAGLSADNLTTLRTTNLPYMEFENHEVLPSNFRNYNLWSSAYNIIYMTNAMLEGLKSSDNISVEVRNQLEGEGRFIRAFTYFYLVNLYGDVPLLLTTDYRENALAGRDEEDDVYLQIVNDLETAVSLLGDGYSQGDRTKVNRYTSIALLARVQLYLENWGEAENLSTQVIEQNGTYGILQELDEVFLANSREAIWQLSPVGRGNTLTHTNEGSLFIIHPTLSFLSNFKLPDSFIESFDAEDKRLVSWIAFHPGTRSNYPFKYKVRNSTAESTEYSMVLRLAEQYLIRAEARAMQDNIVGAINDLDIIRQRAGLELIAESNMQITPAQLLALIGEERKRELFAEWGHRWFDLKRTEKADDVLGAENPTWEVTDIYYPIPEADLLKNPNLTQNEGY